MSIHKMDITAIEKSTYVFKVEFKDEDLDAATPDTMTWSLTDTKGRVINNREDVEVSSPSSTEYIVLGENDLTLNNNDNRIRILTIEIGYDSVTYGDSLTFKTSAEFKILDLIAVS